MTDPETGIDCQTVAVIVAAVAALGALVVAFLSYQYTKRSARENTEATKRAQDTASEANAQATQANDLAEKANETAQQANALNKERLHAEVLPSLGFRDYGTSGDPKGVWFENMGSGPAYNIQIDATVDEDTADNRRQEAETIITQWVKLCQGTRMAQGERRPSCTYMAYLKHVEVHSLTYEDEYRKPHTLCGRGDDLRRVE